MIKRLIILPVTLFALSLGGCGGEEPASPSIRVNTKGCNPADCSDPDGYFLYFTSNIRGDYAVSVHGADGTRWSIVQAGAISQREETKVQIDADDVPGVGGIIRITVVTSDGGTGRTDCMIGPDWSDSRCN